MAMQLEQLLLHTEALLFASERPLSQMELLELLHTTFPEEDIQGDMVGVSIDAIREKYDTDFYPFGLRASGGGFQFLTKKEFHPTVLQLNGDKYIKKLSSAAMETLSIIAYKQPVTKSEIEFIRGVSSDYSIQKLLEKELIIIAGRNEDAVGKPLIYATSRSFMDYLGINSTEQLPKLKEILNTEAITPTIGTDALPEDMNDTLSNLLVDDKGELGIMR